MLNALGVDVERLLVVITLHTAHVMRRAVHERSDQRLHGRVHKIQYISELGSFS